MLATMTTTKSATPHSCKLRGSTTLTTSLGAAPTMAECIKTSRWTTADHSIDSTIVSSKCLLSSASRSSFRGTSDPRSSRAASQTKVREEKLASNASISTRKPLQPNNISGTNLNRISRRSRTTPWRIQRRTCRQLPSRSKRSASTSRKTQRSKARLKKGA